MRIIEKNLRNGIVKLQVETLDDLWALFNVINRGDVVYARTTREVKVGEGSEGRRLPMVLGVRVEGIEYQEFSNKLRVKGVVVDGPEDYGVRGKHHTLSLGLGDVITIVKEKWSDFELDYIEKLAVKKQKVLIVLVDSEDACAAVLAEQGVKYVWERSSNMPSKLYSFDYESALREHIEEVVASSLHIISSEKVDAVIVAGPGEVKNAVKSKIAEKASLPIYVDTTSTGSCSGVKEVLNRDVAKKIAQELALLKAGEIIEEFKELLVKDHELISYGLGNVYNAAVIGAVKKLVVVDELLRSPNEEERRLVYETLNAAYSRRAEVVIIPGKSDIGAEVLGFGGVIAINRFKLQLNIEEFEKN